MLFAFFPLVAAMFYGLAFAMAEKALNITNVLTYMVINTGTGLLVLLYLFHVKGEALNFSFAQDKRDIAFMVMAAGAPSLGWLFTLFAVRNTSALYASFAEISYPLFAVLFLFLFFGLRSIDWTILLGGGLIMLGSFIMLYGQAAK